MTVPLYVVAIVILLILSSYFSATETAFSSLNKIKIRSLATSNSKKSRLVAKLCNDYDSLISTILVGNNIVNIVLTTLATLLFVDIMHNSSWAPTVSSIVITVAVLIFGEITPKTIAKRNPESFAHFSAPFILVVSYTLMPIVWLFGLWQKLVNKIFKRKDDDNITDQELITIVDEAETEGGLNEYESELIRSAIEFDDLTVMDILTPRVDVVSVEYGAKMTDVLQVFRETGYSRLPVYKDSIDTIVGIINEKDFYKVYLDGQKTFNKIIVKNVIYATPRMKISILLRRLQKAKIHLAIVVDEFGGTMGIVTLEDILEELVGDIWDEHDEVVEDFVQITDDKFSVLGEVGLEEFFEYFDVNKAGEEYESMTVSGFVTEKLGHVPTVGDTIEFENLSIAVKRTEYNKIVSVEVVVTPKQTDEENEENK